MNGCGLKPWHGAVSRGVSRGPDSQATVTKGSEGGEDTYSHPPFGMLTEGTEEGGKKRTPDIQSAPPLSSVTIATGISH